MAEAHGKIRRQIQKEEDKKLKAEWAEVLKFKRYLMQHAKREAKKLKDEQKAKKRLLRPEKILKSRGLRMLEA